MILSSADILRVLGADAIIRTEARLSVVDGRPGLDIGDSVYIYVDKYPTIEEFEATWKIWVTDNSGMGEYVLNAMTSLLPNFEFVDGHYITRDFASDRTVVKTEAEKQLEQLAAERLSIREDFSGLQEGLQARLSNVQDGRDGIDGKDGLDGRDGRDGVDGRDGRDLDATETELFDLKDVGESLIPLKKGQVLTWDGNQWTNLFVPRMQTLFSSGGSGSGDGEGVIISETAPETREDGTPLQEGDQWWSSLTGIMYVWYVDSDSGQWVQSSGGGGGSGGSTTLADLLDTDTSGALDGYILVYNGTTGIWEAQPNSGGGGGGGGGSSQCDGILDGGNADNGTANGVDCISSIDDLGDVDTGTDAPDIGDALIWDGTNWVPGVSGEVEEAPQDGQQYARQDGEWEVVESGSGDVEEAPMDNNFYVRQNGSWVNMIHALAALGVAVDQLADGGNFTTGESSALNGVIYDGGNFTTGLSAAINNEILEGGDFT